MPTYRIDWSDRSHSIDADEVSDLDLSTYESGRYHLLHQHKSHRIEVIDVCLVSKRVVLDFDGSRQEITIKDDVDLLVEEMGFEIGDHSTGGDVYAPMPGLVLEVLVEPGQAIEEGTPLLILEAMKMENVIKSTGENTVASIDCQTGAAVEKGQLLLSMED
jgi:biotin carboxyl carrier protein